MTSMEDEIYPITLLTEELKSDEVETRINAMKRIKTVAQVLGPQRTRDELMPFIQEATEDEDEVLAALAEELGSLIDYVGGAEHVQLLLEPLEVLAGVEETVVRDKAVTSLQAVLQVATNNSSFLVPLLKRLSEGDWFTSRVSACALYVTIYPKVADQSARKEIREMFQALSNDDTPMVRRAAATNLGLFAGTLEEDELNKMIVPLFKSLTNDDQDSVRLLAIENCASIGALLSPEDSRTNVLPVVKASVEDRSWRVRFTIAKDFFAVSNALGSQTTESELIGSFATLLQDAEAEVRAASAKNLSKYITIVKPELFASEILPLLSMLSQDTAPNVRSAISIACMELAPMLGEDTSKSVLAPLLQLFLRDEVVDVRLNILKRMDTLSQWMKNFEAVLLPATTDLAKDPQWRVREAVVLAIPAIAGSLGSSYFQEHLLEIYMNAFTDMVSEVRMSATKALPKLLETVGSEYLLQTIVPRMITVFESSIIYQERVNVLRGLQLLASGKSPSAELLNSVVSLTLRAARDKIPNVRFAASMTLEQLCKVTDTTTVSSQVKPCLTELTKDADTDVQYYATVALETAQG